MGFGNRYVTGPLGIGHTCLLIPMLQKVLHITVFSFQMCSLKYLAFSKSLKSLDFSKLYAKSVSRAALQYIVNILGQDGTNLKHLAPSPSFLYIADYKSRLSDISASRDHVTPQPKQKNCPDHKNFQGSADHPPSWDGSLSDKILFQWKSHYYRK